MNRLIFALLFILATGFSPAFGDEIDQMSGDALVQKYLGDSIDLVHDLPDLKTWLVKRGDACEPEVDWILKNVKQYADQVYHSKSQAADDTSKTIYKYIQGHTQNCFVVTSSAYLLASVWIFDRWDATGLSAVATVGCYSYCNGPPQTLYLLILTQALLKAGAIQFVVPQSCAIEFAYLCDPGSIQLNPIAKPIEEHGLYGSSPFDFAGHYLHELDHLFRDKRVSSDYVYSHFPDPNDPSKIDWKNYLLLDETLAKIIAGKVEIGDQSVSSWDGGPKNPIGNDLSLYQKGGPLYEIVNDLSFGGEEDPYSTYAQLVGITFLKQPYKGWEFGAAGSERDLEDVKEIYKIFQNSYFPGIDPNGDTLKLTDSSFPLNPANQSLEFDPLTDLLANQGWGINPYLNNTTAKLPDSDVWHVRAYNGMNLGPFALTLFKTQSPFVVPIRKYMTQIGKLIESLKNETPICHAFNRNLKEAVFNKATTTPLASYFGGSCINPSDPDDGVRADQGSAPQPTPSPVSDVSNALRVTPAPVKMNINPDASVLKKIQANLLENGGRTDSPARP